MKASFFMLFLTLFAFSSCKENADHEHEHSHDVEELAPLVYTLYSQQTELFVEFKPLIVGEESKFAAHFTVLGESFTPLTEAKVTVSLIIGEKGIRQSAEKASSPGIFRLALSPVVAGKGKLIFDIESADFRDQIVIEHITVFQDTHSAMHAAVDGHSDNDITYLKEQAWKVEFANALVTKQAFHEVIKTDGLILSAPGDEMYITANASGNVVFLGNKTIVGSPISQGVSLFSISGGNVSEDNVASRYKSAKIEYDKAKADYDRATILVKEKIVSEKEFLSYKTTFENAEIAFKNVSIGYSGAAQIISAPMSGFIKNILVSEGQHVEPGTPLAVVSKNEKLVLQVNISQRYFDKLSQIQSANFRFPGKSEVFDTNQLNGNLISYGKSASANSPYIPLTFEIDNVGDLIPGSVVEVFLKSSVISDAVLIPVSALIEEQGVYYAFVQTGGETFQKRELKIAADDGLLVQVQSGIAEGERVVVKGAYQIKLATASGALPAHGHEH
jgi:cobalt-zinc-cadmium efflux system membrane fusion protein